jgi:hypothetical protein
MVVITVAVGTATGAAMKVGVAMKVGAESAAGTVIVIDR